MNNEPKVVSASSLRVSSCPVYKSKWRPISKMCAKLKPGQAVHMPTENDKEANRLVKNARMSLNRYGINSPEYSFRVTADPIGYAIIRNAD